MRLDLADGQVGHAPGLRTHGAGHVGREEDVGKLVEGRVLRKQLGLGGVDHRLEPSGDELALQGLAVHQRSARGVDQHGAVGHQRQAPVVQHMTRLGQRRGV
jgi:hypothetical protein